MLLFGRSLAMVRWFGFLWILVWMGGWEKVEAQERFVIRVGKQRAGEGFREVSRVLWDVPYDVEITVWRGGRRALSFSRSLLMRGLEVVQGGDRVPLEATGVFVRGRCLLKGVYIAKEEVLLLDTGGEVLACWGVPDGWGWPGWVSLLPPLIAIVLAFFLKEVVVSLFLGILVGVYLLDPWQFPLRFVDRHLLDVIAQREHIQTIFFSLMFGAMVGIIAKGGGMQALVSRIASWGRTRRSVQTSVWGMGLFIFFDDYANTLLVGNTMRPLTDRARISREKLAYIVDSTAAPVASLAIISTWIGTELSYIQDFFIRAHFSEGGVDAFKVFLMSIPYRFYSIFTLIFVFFIALSLRDFGPMFLAERGAWEGEGDSLRGQRLEGGMEVAEGSHWSLAVVPILLTIVAIFVGLYWHGRMELGWEVEAPFWDVLGSADSFLVLSYCSVFGVILAGFLGRLYGALSVQELVQSAVSGMQAMILAVVILVLAWSLGDVCKNYLYTGEYIAQASRGYIPLWFLPGAIFLLSALVSFATGSSWGTMGILFPLAIPMSVAVVSAEVGFSASLEGYGGSVLLASIAAVLAGASFGDHCSPISDTTVMSSMASGCDHFSHVRTQLPYALTTGLVSIFCGYLLVGWGVSVYISLVFGVVVLGLILRLLGRRVEDGADREKFAQGAGEG